MKPALADDLTEKVLAGGRLTREEGLHLLRDTDLLELGNLAHHVRMKRHPEPVVTFVVDTNPNYTNVCTTDCQFCAFYRKPGHGEGYIHSVPDMVAIVRRA